MHSTVYKNKCCWAPYNPTWVGAATTPQLLEVVVVATPHTVGMFQAAMMVIFQVWEFCCREGSSRSLKSGSWGRSLLCNLPAYKCAQFSPCRASRWPSSSSGNIRAGEFICIVDVAGQSGGADNRLDNTSWLLMEKVKLARLYSAFSNPAELQFTWSRSDGSAHSQIDFPSHEGTPIWEWAEPSNLDQVNCSHTHQHQADVLLWPLPASDFPSPTAVARGRQGVMEVVGQTADPRE